MSRARVLFVGAFPPPNRAVYGGMVTSCAALLESSFSERIELDLLDSTQISNPPPGFLVRLVLAFRRIIRFVSQFERQRPHAVLLFAALGSSLVEKGAMAWYARLRGVPALMFPRAGDLIERCQNSRITRTWVRLALGGAKIMLCQGPTWHRFAVELMGFSQANAPIVPNWTATKAHLAIGRDRLPSEAEEPVRLLFLGWLERRKGVFELLEACSRLAPENRFSLAVAGKGHSELAARKFVAENGLDSRVRFLGWIQGVEAETAFREADVLVLPSWAEGLPNAMIEAMAAGLAVVVSSVGAVPDVVTDGYQALLVPPKDVNALVQALDRIINDHQLREALASRGHAFAADNFAVEPVVDRLVEVIEAAAINSKLKSKTP